jgi:hypothetical protein
MEGEAMDFLVVSHSDTIALPEARAKFGNLWGKRHLRREAQSEAGYQALPKLHRHRVTLGFVRTCLLEGQKYQSSTLAGWQKSFSAAC